MIRPTVAARKLEAVSPGVLTRLHYPKIDVLVSRSLQVTYLLPFLRSNARLTLPYVLVVGPDPAAGLDFPETECALIPAPPWVDTRHLGGLLRYYSRAT